VEIREFTKTIIEDNNNLIKTINNALVDINGKKYLPLWMEVFSNGRLETLSADTLQGIKIGMMYSTYRINELREEEIEQQEKEEENE
jgi:hypothetical protein